MRLSLRVSAISMLVAAGFHTTFGEEAGQTAAPAGRQYTILCRWIDRNGGVYMAPRLILCEGRKGTFANTTQSPFVPGVTPEGDGTARQPNIVVIDEGTVVEVTVLGWRPGGATVDATVEQSTIKDVEARQIDPDTTVQIPHVDIRKKRIIDFVKSGDRPAIPTGEKSARGIVPRVELAVGVGREIKIPANWTLPAERRAQNPGDVQRTRCLEALLMSGGATIRCERVSRWERRFGQRLYETLNPLRDACAFADLYCYCPHKFGLADGMSILHSVTDDPVSVGRVEEMVLGHDWEYSVELSDSPSLISNVLTLAGLPKVWNLTVRTKRSDYGLMHYLTKINVLHDLRLLPGSAGQDFNEDCVRQQWRLHHDAPGYATLTLDATAFVYASDAEALLPSLRTTANLRSVLIVGESDEEEEQANRAKTMLQQALRNAQIETFVFQGSAAKTAEPERVAGNELR